MAQPNHTAQVNAQNSELDPEIHPSGARIEKIMNRERAGDRPQSDVEFGRTEMDKGLYGETLRPSEREDSAVDRASTGDNHRRTPANRQQ